MPYKVPTVTTPDIGKLPPVTLTETADAFIVSGKNFVVSVGKNSGALESYIYKGKQLVASPLVPNFWRPPTDNDRGNKMPERQGIWRDAASTRKVIGVEAKQPQEQVVQITTDSVLFDGKTTYQTTYRIIGDGRIEVSCNFNTPGVSDSAKLPDMPRFGMQMAIPGEFRTMTWYGRGPQENYWDRNTGAAVGIYAGKVEDLIYDYVEPQENGNRTDVRWVTFTNDDGVGLRAKGLPLLSVSAWPYKMEELEKVAHPYEMTWSKDITVNLDYRQMGVGGDDSWGALPHDEYRLWPKACNYSFELQPVALPKSK